MRNPCTRETEQKIKLESDLIAAASAIKKSESSI